MCYNIIILLVTGRRYKIFSSWPSRFFIIPVAFTFLQKQHCKRLDRCTWSNRNELIIHSDAAEKQEYR